MLFNVKHCAFSLPLGSVVSIKVGNKLTLQTGRTIKNKVISHMKVIRHCIVLSYILDCCLLNDINIFIACVINVNLKLETDHSSCFSK